VARRLRELQPLVDEFHELEQIAQRLGVSLDEEAGASGERGSASRQTRRRRSATTNARSAGSPGDAGKGAAAKTAGAALQKRGSRSPQHAANKARSGSTRTSRRQQDILRLVRERPGITVSQIAEELGADASGLYRPFTGWRGRAQSPSRAWRFGLAATEAADPRVRILKQPPSAQVGSADASGLSGTTASRFSHPPPRLPARRLGG